MRRVLAILALVFASGPAHASTMRCGDDLVAVGDATAEVLLKCGEPISRETLAEVREENDELVERWTYAFGPGRFLKILTFQAAVLTAIENGDRQ